MLFKLCKNNVEKIYFTKVAQIWLKYEKKIVEISSKILQSDVKVIENDKKNVMKFPRNGIKLIKILLIYQKKYKTYSTNPRNSVKNV